MSLRQRTLITVGLIILVGIALFYLSARYIILDNYEKIENQEVSNDLMRANNAFQSTLDEINRSLGDWAYWTDTYDFAEGEYPEYLDENVTASTYVALPVNAMAFFATDNRLIAGSYYDAETDTEGDLPPALHDYLVASDILKLNATQSEQEWFVSGIIALPDGLKLVEARAILQSDYTGPAAGTLIWVRDLDDSLVMELAEQTQFDLDIIGFQNQLPTSVVPIRDKLTAENPSTIATMNNAKIAAYTLWTDITDAPAFILRIEQSRTIYQEGQHTINIFLAFMLGIAVVITSFVVFQLERNILSPLSSLSQQVKTLGQSDSFAGRVAVKGQDEIAQFAAALNQSLDALEKSQHSLQLNEQRLRTLVTHAPVALFAIDAQGIMTLMEGQQLSKFNLDQSSVVGNDIALVSQQFPITLTCFRQALQGETLKAEMPSGEHVFEIWYTPSKSNNGSINGVIAVATDITERKRVEDVLREAKKAAEDADAMKSKFLASMSHELRTPLNAILTFTDLIARGTFGPVNEEQVDYLQKSLQSGKHLLALINDVLDITKIQAGMMKLFIEDDFDIAKEMEFITATAEKMLRDKPVELVCEIDQDFPLLRCDKRRVRQVLLNLVSNAVKFTEDGSITIRTEMRDDDILFTVIDTGPGIPSDQQPLIFEPFIQTETGIKYAGGTGLGMPISKQLVEAHGGQLWVESTPGKGATFYATLPSQSVMELGERELIS